MRLVCHLTKKAFCDLKGNKEIKNKHDLAN